MAYCAKGSLLLTLATAEKTITVWDAAKREQIAQWELPEQPHAFAVDPSESFALAVTRIGNAYTWPLPKTRDELK